MLTIVQGPAAHLQKTAQPCLVVVTGSRSLDPVAHMAQVLSERRARLDESAHLHILHGGAQGVDRCAGRWAERNSVDVVVMRADWKTHGRRAGFLRNEAMLRYAVGQVRLGWAVEVLAWWDGQSPGTRHMIDQCRAAGLHGAVFTAR